MRSGRKVARKAGQIVLLAFVVLFGCFYLFGNVQHEVPREAYAPLPSISEQIPSVQGSGWGDTAPFKRAGHAHKRAFINPKVRLDTTQVQDRRPR